MLLPCALIAYSLITTSAAAEPVVFLDNIDYLTLGEPFTLNYTGCAETTCTLFLRSGDHEKSTLAQQLTSAFPLYRYLFEAMANIT